MVCAGWSLPRTKNRAGRSLPKKKIGLRSVNFSPLRLYGCMDYSCTESSYNAWKKYCNQFLGGRDHPTRNFIFGRDHPTRDWIIILKRNGFQMRKKSLQTIYNFFYLMKTVFICCNWLAILLPSNVAKTTFCQNNFAKTICVKRIFAKTTLLPPLQLYIPPCIWKHWPFKPSEREKRLLNHDTCAWNPSRSWTELYG